MNGLTLFHCELPAGAAAAVVAAAHPQLTFPRLKFIKYQAVAVTDYTDTLDF